MTRHNFSTPLGEVRADLAFAADTVALAEFARAAVGLASQGAALAESAAAREGRAVPCRKGCGACCRQLVPLSPGEALMIEGLVASLPEPRRNEILARFAAAERALREAGLAEPLLRLDDPALDDAAHHDLARRYFALRLPCTFLENESCSIHDRRPAACREYSVITPAERCADPFNQAIETLPAPLQVKEALAGLAAQLLGGELQFIPLTLAFAWSRDHPEVAQRKWNAEELAAKFALHLEMRIA